MQKSRGDLQTYKKLSKNIKMQGYRSEKAFEEGKMGGMIDLMCSHVFSWRMV
jgi:hypothetical protein